MTAAPAAPPRRIQRRRAKGWRMPDGAVYVGRGSRWGNPWRVIGPDSDGRWWASRRVGADPYGRMLGPYPSRLDAVHAAIHGYRAHLDHVDTALKAQAALLRGKTLCCWCPLDQPCHADVLLEIANAQEAP